MVGNVPSFKMGYTGFVQKGRKTLRLRFWKDRKPGSKGSFPSFDIDETSQGAWFNPHGYDLLLCPTVRWGAGSGVGLVGSEVGSGVGSETPCPSPSYRSWEVGLPYRRKDCSGPSPVGPTGSKFHLFGSRKQQTVLRFTRPWTKKEFTSLFLQFCFGGSV